MTTQRIIFIRKWILGESRAALPDNIMEHGRMCTICKMPLNFFLYLFFVDVLIKWSRPCILLLWMLSHITFSVVGLPPCIKWKRASGKRAVIFLVPIRKYTRHRYRAISIETAFNTASTTIFRTVLRSNMSVRFFFFTCYHLFAIKFVFYIMRSENVNRLVYIYICRYKFGPGSTTHN